MIKRTCAECGVSEVWAYINELQLCDACWQEQIKQINKIGGK